jgi:hypothetical protein
MRRRRLFLFFTLSSIGALVWGGRQLDAQPVVGPPALSRGGLPAGSASAPLRRELLETLDRLAAYQGYYRSVYGHYTKILGRVGLSIPHRVAETYDIRVQEASTDRFLILAVSESRGQVEDFISIDHLYRIQANFRLPLPSAQYLRDHAERQLRRLRAAGGAEGFRETGVYRSFFSYGLTRDSHGEWVATARGIAEPVRDLELQLGADNELAGQEPGELERRLGTLAGGGGSRTGERPRAEPPAGNAGLVGALEEVYLAQRIFRGETGRYARSWDELERLASFRFERREALELESGGVPFGDDVSTIDLDSVAERQPASRAEPAIPAADGLLIEPL